MPFAWQVSPMNTDALARPMAWLRPYSAAAQEVRLTWVKPAEGAWG